MTKKNWIGITALCIFAFIIFMDVTIVGNAIPTIQKYFHASTDSMQWLLLALFLTYSSLMLIFSKISEYVGLRKLLYTSFVLFAFASLGAGLSESIGILILFRFLQGLSSSTLCLIPALIAQNCPPEKQAQGIGLFTTMGGIGVGIGPIIGGFLVQYISWRWVFFINIPCVIISLTTCLLTVTELKHEKPTTRFDWLGSLLLTTFLSSLVLISAQGHQWGWASPVLKILYILCAVSLLAFIFVESKVKDPIMHLNFLLDHIFISAILIGIVGGVVLGVCLFYDPIYNQVIRDFSPVSSGLLLAIVSVMMIIMTPITVYITNKYGAKFGCVLVLIYAMICIFIHTQYGINSSVFYSILAMIFLGLAWCAANISPMTALIQAVPTRNQASAIGVYGTSWNLGSCVGLGISSVIFYLLEKSFFLKHLNSEVKAVFQAQPDLAEKLLDNPEHINKIVHLLPANIAQSILDVYKVSYMHAFEWLMYMLTALVFCALIFVLLVMKKNSRAD